MKFYENEIAPFLIEGFPFETDIVTNIYYEQIALCIDKLIKSGYGKSIMGTKSFEDDFNKINLLHYFMVYLLFMREDIAMDVDNGITFTEEEYKEKYKIACILKNISCTGCEIDIDFIFDTGCSLLFQICTKDLLSTLCSKFKK